MNLKQIFSDIVNVTLPLFRKYRGKLVDIRVTQKSDLTLLTQADIDIQKAILDVIYNYTPNCRIIAEEDTDKRSFDLNTKYTWIVDPIDGTSEFVSAEGKEFCTAICVLADEIPIGAMVLLPEISGDNEPVIIEGINETRQILINGILAVPLNRKSDVPARISATRSKGTDPRFFEQKLKETGCTLKTRTTSQTVDLLRLATDPTQWTDSLNGFDLFYRQKQKIWDGAPGIFLNYLAGRIAVDEQGNSLIPFSKSLLRQSAPVLPVTIVGDKEHISWFLNLCNEY